MCGFVGFIDGGDTQLDSGILHAMTDAIRHRGPDDADYYMDGSISLGFRRLSIIDLEGGRQPILNEDGSKVLMFNGEIYNYQEIRKTFWRRVMCSKPPPIRKCFSMAMRNMAWTFSTSFGACLPSSSGTKNKKSCLALGISSASSPFITPR